MKFFIDTANLNQIKEAHELGILDGVTTNPSLMSKEGIRGQEAVNNHYKTICEMVDGPISLETVSPDAKGMIAEGRELVKIHENVVIKIVNTKEGLKAVKALSAEGIRTNVTVTFSPLQALLAAKCGATYISPFVGRLDAVGHIGMDCIRQIRDIYDNYSFETQILTAAVRHPHHVLEAALAGSDCCTLSFEVLEQLYNHPLTDIAIDIFNKDWAKVPKP